MGSLLGLELELRGPGSSECCRVRACVHGRHRPPIEDHRSLATSLADAASARGRRSDRSSNGGRWCGRGRGGGGQGAGGAGGVRGGGGVRVLHAPPPPVVPALRRLVPRPRREHLLTPIRSVPFIIPRAPVLIELSGGVYVASRTHADRRGGVGGRRAEAVPAAR